MIHLSAAEREIVGLVARYVDSEVRPVVRDLEHEDTYPEKIIEQMKEMGVYGMCIPEPYGEFGVSTPCFVLVTEELARGWMSLAGAFGGHSVVSKLIHQFGTDEQRLRYLPAMATGELRAAMALTEPSGGSDLQAIRTVARGDGDSWVISGSKMWITNARRSGLIAVLCKTDVDAVPAHKGIGILLVEADADFVVSADLSKMGYKGIETCELSFDECRVPRDALLGGVEGHGFSQMMSGLEIGRLQVAARATGVAPRRLRRRAGVLAGARDVREADLAAPVGGELPRRHGHQHRVGPAAARRRGGELRDRATQRPRGGDGQVARVGGGDASRTRRPPHPRGLRVLA